MEVIHVVVQTSIKKKRILVIVKKIHQPKTEKIEAKGGGR